MDNERNKMKIGKDVPELSLADMGVKVYCDLEHEDMRDAVALMCMTCADCETTWTAAICGGHATAVGLLKAVGGDIDCWACRKDVPLTHVKVEAL